MMTDIASTEAAEDSDPSAHMSARMRAQTRRIEEIARGERRRRWSVEEKLAIVTESLEPNASVAGIARKHGIGTGQLYRWRHQFLVHRPKDWQLLAPALAACPHKLLGLKPFPEQNAVG